MHVLTVYRHALLVSWISAVGAMNCFINYGHLICDIVHMRIPTCVSLW